MRIEKKERKEFSLIVFHLKNTFVEIKKVPTHWKGLEIEENRSEDFWFWKARDLKSPRLESDCEYVSCSFLI